MVAFIINNGIGRFYPHWDRLYCLMKLKYNIKCFDYDIGLPNYINTPSIPELKRQLETCQAYIATDGGVMHIADLLSMKGIVIFGATNEVKSGPVNGEVITCAVSCRPCYNNGRVNCNNKYRCLDIDPAEIMRRFSFIHK